MPGLNIMCYLIKIVSNWLECRTVYAINNSFEKGVERSVNTFKTIRGFVLLFVAGAVIMEIFGFLLVAVLATAVGVPSFMLYDERKYCLERKKQKKSSTPANVNYSDIEME